MEMLRGSGRMRTQWHDDSPAGTFSPWAPPTELSKLMMPHTVTVVSALISAYHCPTKLIVTAFSRLSLPDARSPQFRSFLHLTRPPVGYRLQGLRQQYAGDRLQDHHRQWPARSADVEKHEGVHPVWMRDSW